jgi:hypothetical protein
MSVSQIGSQIIQLETHYLEISPLAAIKVAHYLGQELIKFEEAPEFAALAERVQSIMARAKKDMALLMEKGSHEMPVYSEEVPFMAIPEADEYRFSADPAQMGAAEKKAPLRPQPFRSPPPLTLVRS